MKTKTRKLSLSVAILVTLFTIFTALPSYACVTYENKELSNHTVMRSKMRLYFAYAHSVDFYQIIDGNRVKIVSVECDPCYNSETVYLPLGNYVAVLDGEDYAEFEVKRNKEYVFRSNLQRRDNK